MISQNTLKPALGSRKDRKRVGRGDGSGHGTYATRGLKGQKSRSGAKVRPGFEGGQTPLSKKLPYKRGFSNPFREEYVAVNLYSLNIFPDGCDVNRELLVERGIIKSSVKLFKVLGHGNLKRKLQVTASAFSKSAEEKIAAAGGNIKRE